MSDTVERKVFFNGKEMSLQEFEQEKALLAEKNMKLVEVAKDQYKTRLED